MARLSAATDGGGDGDAGGDDARREDFDHGGDARTGDEDHHPSSHDLPNELTHNDMELSDANTNHITYKLWLWA